MTATTTSWRNFASTRTPCPGCEAAGYVDSKGNPSHALCRERQADRGRVIQCRKLQPGSEPDDWRVFGEGAQGTTAFFISDGTPRAESHRRRPVARRPSPNPDPKVAPDAVLDLIYSQVRTFSAEHAVASERAAKLFFEKHGADWRSKLYSVMPTKSEERELLNRISLDGLDDYQVPGLNLRGRGRWFIRAKADPEAAYIEWVLGPDGGIRGMRYRFLAPTDTKTKLHGRHRLHHPAGWREQSCDLFLTEGVRKANETQRLTGAACLGLPGIHPRNLASEILEAVKIAKPDRVILAPDFADLTNGERTDDVRRAVFSQWLWLAKRITAACGAHVVWATWPSEFKGIDDALVAGAGIETQDLDAYLKQWNWRDDPPKTWQRRKVNPFPNSTAAPVTTIEEAVERVEAVAESWEPGVQSLALSAFPGTSKTTMIALEAISRLDRGELGCAVLALPTRSDVREKVERLRGLADAKGLNVPILPALGASETESEGFHCVEIRRRQARASLGHWGCDSCPAIVRCQEEPGRFKFDDREVKGLAAAASPTNPVFLVTTQAKVLADLERVLPEDATIIVDDIGDPSFGMVHEHTVKLEDIATAADAAESFVVSANLGVAFRAFQKDPTKIPDVLIAQLAADVLAAVHDANDVTVAAAIDKYDYPEVLDVIASDALTRPWGGWGWEKSRDADGLLPHFTGLLVFEIVRGHVAGTRCTVSRDRSEVKVTVPHPGLLDRARRGNLVWLSVGRMPAVIAKNLDVRREHIDADPQQAIVVAASDRLFGVRDDDLVRKIVESIRARVDTGDMVYSGHRFSRPGAVLRKKARNGMTDNTGVVHYGAGHASSDALDDRDVLVVSRTAVPVGLTPAQVRTITGMLGLDTPEDLESVRKEWRGWGGHLVHRQCLVPVNSIAADVAGFYETQLQLNAVGRCRPLSALTPRLIVILAGIPFPGIRVDDVVSLEDLALDLGLEDLEVAGRIEDQVAADERKAIAAQERKEVVRRFVEDYRVRCRAFPSERTIAREVEMSRRRVREALAEEIRDPGPQVEHPRGGRTGEEISVPEPVLEHKKKRVEIGALGPQMEHPPSVRDLASKTGLGIATISRTLNRIRDAEANGLPVSMPAREDGRRNLQRVLDAIEAIREEARR